MPSPGFPVKELGDKPGLPLGGWQRNGGQTGSAGRSGNSEEAAGGPDASSTGQLLELGSSPASGPGAVCTVGTMHSWLPSTPYQSAPARATSADSTEGTTCCGVHG